jgi:hypothetical protein
MAPSLHQSLTPRPSLSNAHFQPHHLPWLATHRCLSLSLYFRLSLVPQHCTVRSQNFTGWLECCSHCVTRVRSTADTPALRVCTQPCCVFVREIHARSTNAGTFISFWAPPSDLKRLSLLVVCVDLNSRTKFPRKTRRHAFRLSPSVRRSVCSARVPKVVDRDKAQPRHSRCVLLDLRHASLLPQEPIGGEKKTRLRAICVTTLPLRSISLSVCPSTHPSLDAFTSLVAPRRCRR